GNGGTKNRCLTAWLRPIACCRAGMPAASRCHKSELPVKWHRYFAVAVFWRRFIHAHSSPAILGGQSATGGRSMERTANLDLPYIMPSQAQKHVTHNEAIRALDAIVQLGVIDRDRSEPPSEPREGDRHIVGPSPLGAWQGQQDRIAAWQDNCWMFYPPASGWLAFVAQEQLLVAWDGTGWNFAGGQYAIVETLSINRATADGYNRLAINAPASLFNHDGNGHRLVINKNQPGDSATILFQTGFSGRAEFGLAGDDAWRVKLSTDGENWTEVLTAHSNGLTAFAGPLRLPAYVLAQVP